MMALFIGYTLLLLSLGFRKKVGYCSWHMFANLHMCEFHLFDSSTGVKLNPYSILPHTQLSMNQMEVKALLAYFRRVSKVIPEGWILFSNQGQDIILRVVNGHLVD
jgi:hypothetical protein